MRLRFSGAALALCFAASTAFAQPKVAVDDGDLKVFEAENDPKLSKWPYFVELQMPKDVAPKTRFAAVDVPGAVVGKASSSLADLRLTDAEGKRIPYALRVRRASETQKPIAIERRFDAGPTVKDRGYEESFELAPVPLPGHNEIEIRTSGRDFRRAVQVVGANSPDFKGAQSLLPAGSHLVDFIADGRPVVVNRFRYDHKLFRFLKVRVEADRYNGEAAPKIESVVVYQSEKTPGHYVTYPIIVGSIEGVRGSGGPATAYSISLGDEPTFCEKLNLRVDGDAGVDRPFRLQIAAAGRVREDVGGVEWRWRGERPERSVELTFPEVRARSLRLVVTDYANPPLGFVGGTATMAARQLLFELPDPAKMPLPLKLFFGYDEAFETRYDLAKTLPPKFDPPPASVGVGPRQENPHFVPPPRDFSERYPWVVYVALGAASLVLAFVLMMLAKQSLAAANVADGTAQDATG